jgi:hypothetical protein
VSRVRHEYQVFPVGAQVGRKGFPGLRQQGDQPVDDEINRLPLEIALVLLESFKYRERAGSKLAVVQVNDLRIEQERFFTILIHGNHRDTFYPEEPDKIKTCPKTDLVFLGGSPPALAHSENNSPTP